MKSTNGSETSKELKGDGLSVVMEVNKLNLKVSGDGCRVTVAKNCGSIRVIGDGCSLKVNRNDGDIEYKGDGGCIFLGGGSKTDSVSYVGDGGRITVGVKKERHERKAKRTEGCSVSDSELEMNRENAANESKEAKERANKTFVANQQRAREFRREGANLRRSKTTIVAKISSEETQAVIVNNTKHPMKNWFRNPASVIRTFKSDPE